MIGRIVVVTVSHGDTCWLGCTVKRPSTVAALGTLKTLNMRDEYAKKLVKKPPWKEMALKKRTASKGGQALIKTIVECSSLEIAR